MSTSRWILHQLGTNYSSGAERSMCNKFDLEESFLIVNYYYTLFFDDLRMCDSNGG